QSTTNFPTVVPGTRLRFQQHVAEFDWHQLWGQSSPWSSDAKLGLELSQDNGSGYFDFWRYRASHDLKYHGIGWSVSTQFSVSYYDFPVQTISPSGPLRQKLHFNVGARVEKTLFKSLKFFASYLYDVSASNLSVDEYAANTGSAGLEWGF